MEQAVLTGHAESEYRLRGAANGDASVAIALSEEGRAQVPRLVLPELDEIGFGEYEGLEDCCCRAGLVTLAGAGAALWVGRWAARVAAAYAARHWATRRAP